MREIDNCHLVKRYCMTYGTRATKDFAIRWKEWQWNTLVVERNKMAVSNQNWPHRKYNEYFDISNGSIVLYYRHRQRFRKAILRGHNWDLQQSLLAKNWNLKGVHWMRRIIRGENWFVHCDIRQIKNRDFQKLLKTAMRDLVISIRFWNDARPASH